MTKLFLSLCVLVLYFCPFTQGQEPDMNKVVFIEEEPQPLNMHDVRNLIGYPKIAIDLSLSGQVLTKVLVNGKGEYVKHKTLQYVPILSEAVDKHLSNLTFSPPMNNGDTLSFWISIPLTFKFSSKDRSPLGKSHQELIECIYAFNKATYIDARTHVNYSLKYKKLEAKFQAVGYWYLVLTSVMDDEVQFDKAAFQKLSKIKDQDRKSISAQCKWFFEEFDLILNKEKEKSGSFSASKNEEIIKLETALQRWK